MLTRCQFASHLSKVASTSQIISRPCQSIASSSREPGPSSIRRFSKEASIRREKRSPHTTPQIEWPTESWDDIFKDLDNEPFKPRRTITKKSQNPEPTVPKATKPHAFFPRPVQRQTLTRSERDTLSDMVDMILQPESEKDTPDSDSAKQTETLQVNSLIHRLRQYSRKQKKAKLGDESLDKKLEEISLCTTDLELLEWASREVFGESTRLAERATTAMAQASSRTGQVAEIPLLQSPLYPSLIAHLMRTFRVQYQDPHLALSIFDHARNLSTLSFVFGCSTGAYNELIETQWMISHNLEVIHSSVEEMVVNGVSPDNKTRKLVEGFRQQLFQTRTPEDDMQVRDMHFLTKIEQLLSPTKRLKANRYEEWKSGKLSDDNMQEFDDWKPPPRRQQKSQPRAQGIVDGRERQTMFSKIHFR